MGALDKFRLDGKVALVAGVGPTNSRHFALACAEAGADVCLAARSGKVSEPLAEEIRAMGRRALPIAVDLTDSGQVDRMAAQAKEELGRIDVLFNHVGGVLAGSKSGPILEMSDEDWSFIFTCNLDAMFYCTRAVGRIMIEQGTGGSIINTSSTASISNSRNLVGYSTAKAAVNQFTRAMAAELAPHDIRVNAIMLGAFENAVENINRINPGWVTELIESIPAKRLGKAGDSAAAALYLASDASAYVTGTIMPVHGGMSMYGA